MNIKSIYVLSALAAVAMTVACSSSRESTQVTETSPQIIATTRATVSSYTPQSAMLIKAKIYKTNGDYIANVPVNVSGDKLISYPAPSDLGPGSMPVKLDGGFLLDRRGIGPDTRFTTYTYEEYAAFPESPSVEELMAAIIPDARVTEIIEMPFAYSHEAADKCNELIATGLPGCQIIFPY